MTAVHPVDLSDERLARRAHAVWTLAYQQEARLLAIDEFPPLHKTVEHLRDSFHVCLAAFNDEQIVGLLGLEKSVRPGPLLVAALVVHPDFQRRGIASALVSAALHQANGSTVEVETATRNEPALRLYRKHHFVEAGRRTVASGLELVKLAHPGRSFVLPGERRLNFPDPKNSNPCPNNATSDS